MGPTEELKESRENKKQQKKKQTSTSEGRVVDSLATTAILRKTKTNPHANITLSGKKKRLLLKALKKQQKLKQELDKTAEVEMNEKKASKNQPVKKEKMEVD